VKLNLSARAAPSRHGPGARLSRSPWLAGALASLLVAAAAATSPPLPASRAAPPVPGELASFRRALTRLVSQDLVTAGALQALADSLETRAAGDTALRAIARAARARSHFRSRDVATATREAQQAQALAEASGDSFARFHALRQSATLAMNRGDFEPATRGYVDSLAAARASGEPLAAVTALASLGTVTQFAGALEDAVRYYVEARELAARLDEPGLEASIENNLGYLSIENRDLDAAVGSFDRAAALAARSGNAQIAFTQASGRAMLALARGDAAGAVSGLRAILLRADPHIDAYLRGELQVFLARAQLAAGQGTAAGEAARRAIAQLAGMPMRALPAEVVLADALVASGRNREAAARAREAAARAAPGTRVRAELLDAQARALAAAGDHAAAYAVQGAALLERDRSSSDRARLRLGLLQARLDDALAQRELALLRAQRAASEARSAQSRQQRNLALALLVIVALAGVIVAMRLRRRRALEQEAARLQRLDALGQLTGGVAHDFNNLLTVVEQAAGLLGKRGAVRADPVAMRLVEESRGAARSGARITRQLLAFARRQPLAPQPLVLDVYLLGIRDLLARTIGDRLRLEIEVERPSPLVEADRAQLTATLISLLANARDASAPGESVRVEVRRDHEQGARVAIAVVDRGSGMSPEVAERATEPFFTTRADSGGAGLGLSMADGFCRQSGGALRIDSVPGRGTSVRILLPEAPPPANTPAVRTPNTQGRFFGHGVLLVEDNDRLRRVLELSLAEIGFEVVSAASGDAAREYLSGSACPTLLFSDIRMPGKLNGVQLAAWAVQRCPQLRVLLQTGYAEEDAGRFAVLRKPFTAEELVDAIARVMSVGAADAADAARPAVGTGAAGETVA
jgi:signal transduction histidine kinase/CheY-like chemotaxis protein